MDRALSFGSAAADYHRYRPGYPEALVELVLAHVTGPLSRAIEVGAGTGKATAVFTTRVPAIVAVEPDPEMRAVLTQEVIRHGWGVEVVGSTYEELDPERVGTFDLLYAAASFHWTDPISRWDRAVALLRPGGTLAVFGAARDLADPGLRDAVDALTADTLGSAPGLGWTTADLEAHPGLTAVVEASLPQHESLSAADYLAHLATVSAYRVLADDARADLLARVRDLLPDPVETLVRVPVHLARRTASPHPRSTP
ncbi:class I SAM-dependent methyltransferase [Nocardioides rubriscoriae]|uniref:class I SAM-dependent methyltransferase n=1 Tax=Nocardioides rubriscoriae TaxID=642762 RepID=UPI0014787CB9|nr:class I SAM-dependent methyltransferase [Nocardioides rubriscoriae]